jgi:hypothetical protein
VLIADIRGKLSLGELVSEDFLTSAVFSSLRYLGSRYLEEFLSQAINSNKAYLDLEIDSPKYDFWPWYPPVPPLDMGAEPDLVIYSGEMAIIVEAKNYSGKSGHGTVPSEPSDSPEEQEQQIIDQLARQYIIGRKAITGSTCIIDGQMRIIKEIVLVYVTRHSRFPETEIDETLQAIAARLPDQIEDARRRIFWVNWQKLYPLMVAMCERKICASFEYMLAQDLVQFLDRRGLSSFRGFEFLDKFEGSRTMPFDASFYQTQLNEYWNFLPVLFEDSTYIFYTKSLAEYWNPLENCHSLESDKIDFYTGG